jgi:hypothetical protein
MYANGQGVAKDYKKAVALYREAAQAGSADAVLNLGAMYFQGFGVAHDLVAAYALANVAASMEGGTPSNAVSNRDITTGSMSAAQIKLGDALTSRMQKDGLLKALDSR